LLKKCVVITSVSIGLILGIYSCKESDPVPVFQDPPVLTDVPSDVAVQWADMTLYTLRFSAFNSPTYSSRSLGYLGLAMYESIVQGDSINRSLSGQLNGLTLPLAEAGKEYHWVLSLNAAQHSLLKLLYPVPGNSHRYIHERIDSLHDALYTSHATGIDPEIVDRSVQFGESIALTIYDWSLTDGGDKGYTKNFDPSFSFPEGDSYWVPPFAGQTPSLYPLHPHWGKNRTFVIANGALPVPAIIPFSTDPASDYYQLYLAVYAKDSVLTHEEREIAGWWGDDPTETFSPPGHSYFTATLAVRKSNVKLVTAAQAYARVGMAVADAFIHCWKVKYTYFNERPSSYVNKYIDSLWIQFWPEPPFPAFPSGHSIQASSAATVLTDLFGEPFSFTDDSHEGYRRFDNVRFLDLTYPARSFTSFWQAANECATSRFLGGIHTKQDNEIGLQEGLKIGGHINELHWEK
jgi:hypothetical protein